MGLFSWLGLGGKPKQTQGTQSIDPATAQYIQQIRSMALGGAGAQQSYNGPFRPQPQASGVLGMNPGQLAQQYMNPYQSQVIDATRGEFDHMRRQAAMGTDQQATMAGAFGGSRHGIAEGARLGEIDRAQGQTVADLMYSGYNNALGYGQGQQQMAMNFLGMGMTPLGSSMQGTESGGGNPLAQWVGLGLTGYGLYQQGKAGQGAPMGGGMPMPGGSGGMAYSPYSFRRY